MFRVATQNAGQITSSEYDKSAVASAQSVFKQISTVYESQFSDEPPPNTILHHYTSAEGLKGIIESNELWATSAYYLNDSAEMFYGYHVLKELLDDWLSKNPRPDDSITLALARQLRTSFEDLFQKRLLRPIYLTCFCEEDNLLSQWRAYGQSGGYSVGFRVLPKIGIFGERLTPEPNIYTCRWIKVEYERTKQLEICRSILEPIFEKLDDPITTQKLLRQFRNIPSSASRNSSRTRWTFSWKKLSDSKVKRSAWRRNGVLLFAKETFSSRALTMEARHPYPFTFALLVEC